MNSGIGTDREQFAQLIGYSIGGFSELSYVTDETYARAKAAEEDVLRELEENDG